jgi:hypothetical protein
MWSLIIGKQSRTCYPMSDGLIRDDFFGDTISTDPCSRELSRTTARGCVDGSAFSCYTIEAVQGSQDRNRSLAL